MRHETCCFTGHRPNKLPSGWLQDDTECAPLRRALRTAIVQAADNGYRRFISGMAQGIDTWAAEEVLDLQSHGRDVHLIAALPCPNQAIRWSVKARLRLNTLLAEADEVYTVCDEYTPFCMGARNLWMVERSSLLIAVFDGSKGGTANTISHAERFGLDIVRINPNEVINRQGG
ncbi:MAG TPA: DUF1273 domain-containing protein [Ruminococcaceae bacterium]|nr:DUF1273 domain-containing protein [Oscillospiraceae bacterium]